MVSKSKHLELFKRDKAGADGKHSNGKKEKFMPDWRSNSVGYSVSHSFE